MAKRENRRIKNIKRRITADMRGVDRIRLILCASFVLVCGLIAIFANMDAALCTVLVFPAFTPPLFILTLLRICVFFLPGLSLGLLIGHSSCDGRAQIYRYCVAIMALVIGELIWINLLYRVSLPLICFFSAVVMFLVSIYLFLSLKRSLYSVTFMLCIYAVVNLCRIIFSLFLIGLN